MSARLRHPLTAQMTRYAIAGVVTAVVGIGAVFLLTGPGRLAIQLAILLAYPLNLAVHFSLQRYFVFADRDVYTLAVGKQLRRYLVVAIAQYGCIAAATALLVHVAGLGDRPAYLIAIAAAPVILFITLRVGVFH
ncbi:GtrA family protein [Baekduia sp.]|uniref:GtrA family protein n=1 Tax=Baekduia sp. TaxID=2600305 RepID=UPI002E05A2BF|nr:GtrA family protein [Baekduia sp.]